LLKLDIPKLGTFKIQLSKHGKPLKTCIPKTDQGRLMLGRESWTTFHGTLEP
jgi:hypothetical protein